MINAAELCSNSGGEPLTWEESTPKVAPTPKVSRWQRITVEIITMTETLALGDVAWRTHAIFPFVNLVVEKEVCTNDTTTKQQFPVYFVSEVLTGSKRFYSKVEKICYAIIMSVRKLRHYFEAHTIKVLTNQLLNDILSNRDNSERISKWATKLSKHVVNFEKCSTIKS
jgi:hypothetical protein